MNTEYVVMPREDYELACNKLREKTDSPNLIKSGELVQRIEEVFEKGKAEVIPAKEEQEKTIEITQNGTTEILPDEGKVLSKAIVNVNVPSGDTELAEAYAELKRNHLRMFEQSDWSTITVPDGCTKIGDYAFYQKNVVCGKLPDSVVSVGNYAFYNHGYRGEYLPPTLKSIGTYAFYKNNLSVTELPKDVTEYPEACFYGVNDQGNFKISRIPAGVTSIGAQAFFYIRSITELTFEGTPNSISSTAFQECTNLLNIYVPWSEGEVANSPWGATNSTIHYNSEV